MKVSEIKLNYGFLRRLKEEGQNVNIGQEINDILYLDEKERATKERLEAEHRKKMKKPRPRDVVDFEELKRIQYMNENEKALKRYKQMEEDQESDLSKLIERGLRKRQEQGKSMNIGLGFSTTQGGEES